MKKVLILALFACIALVSKAESYIGGSIGYSLERLSDKSYTETSSVFTIAPEGGHKFNDTWALGASVGLAYYNNYDVLKISVLPYLRATFAHAGIVDFFGEIAAGYGYETSGNLDLGTYGGSYRYQAGSFEAALRPGFVVNTSNKFALQFRTTLIGYSHYGDTNYLGLALNGNFELGFMFKF